MNKFVTIAAAAAFATLAACSDNAVEAPADVATEATEAAVELADDGTVAVDGAVVEDAPVAEAEATEAAK